MKITALIFVYLLATKCSIAQTDSPKIMHARKVLELTGSGKLGVQMCNMIVASYKKQFTKVPAAFWDELASQFDAKEFIDICAPIYVKNFTDEDLIGLIAFYETPLGQKLITTLPVLTTDAYAAGEANGRVIQQRISKK